MIRLLLFALLFAMPVMADDVFMNNTTSESDMCVISVTGQTASTPNAVAHANWSPITYNCSAGTYLPADGIECATCTAGNYCIGGNYTYNETTTQGLTPCTANYTSSAGASTCVPMTYNINYVLNGGNALPSGYTQLEYIQSTGTQWIDTGIYAPNVTRFIIKGFVTNNGTMNTQLLGGTQGGVTEIFGSRYFDAFSMIESWYPVNQTHNDGLVPNNVVATTDATLVSPYVQTGTITNESTNESFTFNNFVDGTTWWSFPAQNLLLFGGDSNRRSPLAKCYYLILYTNTGIVFSGIPARRNSDNVLGMYDTVSGTFFTNDGTGTFVAGPDMDKYTYGVGATIDSVPTRTHSSFVGWCTDVGLTNCAATQTIGTTATGDKTFYAKYLCDTGYSTNVSNTACSANTITVNWDNGAGGATQNTCTYGGDLTTPTTAPTKRGHVFTGWTFDLN